VKNKKKKRHGFHGFSLIIFIEIRVNQCNPWRFWIYLLTLTSVCTLFSLYPLAFMDHNIIVHESGIRNPQSAINLKRLADAEEEGSALSLFVRSAVELEAIIEA
jgi:hypothetical protein